MNSSTTPQHTTLFVKTGCPYCAKAREFLAAQHIDFIERNVSDDSDALADMKRFSGSDKAPVLIYEGDVLGDFDVEELKPFLEKHGASLSRA